MTNQLTFGFVCPLSELSMIDRLKIRIQIIRYCSWFDFSREIERTDESGAGKTSDHLETVMRIKVSFEKCSFGTKVIVKENGTLGTAILAKIKQSDVYEPFLLIDAMLPKDIIEKIKQAGKTEYRTFWFERQRGKIRSYVFPNLQEQETKLSEKDLKSKFVKWLDDFKSKVGEKLGLEISANVSTKKHVSVQKRELGGVVVRVTHIGLGENEEMQNEVHDELLQSAFYPDSEPALITTPAGVSDSSGSATSP